MNITLENFLNHIFGDRSGKVPMVWIYQNDSNFYPDEQGFAESELLAVYRSNFVPSMTFREDFATILSMRFIGRKTELWLQYRNRRSQLND